MYGYFDPDTLGHLDRVEFLTLGDRVFTVIDDDGRHGLPFALRLARQNRELPGSENGVGAIPWAIFSWSGVTWAAGFW